MSQFNKTLDQAKHRQKRIYLFSGLTVFSILLLVTVLFIVSRGTRVEITPAEAKELATIDVIAGFSFSIGDSIYSLTGNPVISVSAPGFKVATETIDSAYLGKVFPLELFELPGRLFIGISGNDQNLSKTTWRINDRDMAFSEQLDLELEAGSYTVAINNPFFQPKELAVEIKRREQKQLQVDLQSVDGTLNIASKPSGAAVLLDAKVVGQTPLKLDRKGGLYHLRVVAKGYDDTVEQLTITRAKPEVSRNYQLELKKAKVTFNLIPKGGTLLANGAQVTEPLFLNAIVEHRLSYMKTGYYTQTQTVRLAVDEEKKVTFQLKEEIGQVEISASPPASVWIGGKDYGVSPVSVSLPAIAHKIILKKPGYRFISKMVKPVGGSVQKVSVTLLPEKLAKLQEAPREFTNQAGIKLKLFLAKDTLTMGAPRSEKGQRANEFLRKIRLTKPFYASLFEITNNQFTKFDPQKSVGAANVPVTSISWQAAASYCNWLSKQENLRPFYNVTNGMVVGFNTNADGYRLLSEGEWEWLARKSGKTKQTTFTWGNETVIPPKAANVADERAKGQVRFYVPNYRDGYAGIAPVGLLNRESSGLYDMAGNVSEWVHDVYSLDPPLTDTIVSNPLGAQRGPTHVVKGANFRSGTITTLRSAFREGLTHGRDDVGFRIGRYLYGGENE